MLGSTTFTGRVEGVGSWIPLFSLYIDVQNLLIATEDNVCLTCAADVPVHFSTPNESLCNDYMLSNVT